MLPEVYVIFQHRDQATIIPDAFQMRQLSNIERQSGCESRDILSIQVAGIYIDIVLDYEVSCSNEPLL